MRHSRQPGPLNPLRTWSLDLGAGGDSNTVPATITKAEYEWIDGTAISGTLNMSAAVSVWAVFRCQGILTISGTIDGDGDGGAGGAAGGANSDGGIGAGPGRGLQGFGGAGTINRHGGGGGHAAAGGDGGASPGGSASYGGPIYDSFGAILAQTYGAWCTGSGGGGGGGNEMNAGGAGGNGGAGIIIVARQVVLTGTITADGTNGAAGGAIGPAGTGGSGSGGLVIILAEQINCTGGTITATAGGGTVAGGAGRIYLCYTKGLVSSGTCTPAAVTIDLRAPASAG